MWVFIYSCGQRAKRACLHAHLATAARVNTPQLCCVASLMPRQLAAGLLTMSKFRTCYRICQKEIDIVYLIMMIILKQVKIL